MPTAVLHCFSGTGNSRMVADRLAAGLGKRGYEATLHLVESGSLSGIAGTDLHVFLFPVYAGAVPHNMIKYIRSLPQGNGARAAVLATNGRISTRFRDGHQGWALHQARLLLQWRGYAAFFSDTVDLPHNVTVFGPPRQDQYNRAIVEMAAPAVDRAAERIASGEGSHRRINPLHFLWSVPSGLLYGLLGRRGIGKMLAADHRCSGCSRCAKACPVKNIAMRDARPRFGWRCEGCMRCINLCPRAAIQLSGIRLAGMVFVSVWNPLAAFGLYRPGFLRGALGGFFGCVVEVLLACSAAVALYAMIDSLVFLMGFIPGVRRMTGWGHTALFGRYDSRKFTKDLNP